MEIEFFTERPRYQPLQMFTPQRSGVPEKELPDTEREKALNYGVFD
jgi:hypothetical protein